MEHLFEETKLTFLTANHHKDKCFSDFCKRNIMNKELVGRYLVGLETSTLFWLVDCFQHISQTHNYYSMYSYLCKIINKFA
jgi:hypothetical protein